MARCSLIYMVLFFICAIMCSSGKVVLDSARNFEHTEKVNVEVKNQTQTREVSIRGKRQASVAYYDFLINEGSFKFWAIFQMVTIAILFYSTFAAIYYAKYTYLHDMPSEEDGDIFLRRSDQMNRILRAIHTPPA